jgi:hypothetical protein
MIMAIKANINKTTSHLASPLLVLALLSMLAQWIMVVFLSAFACRWQDGTAVHIDRADNGYL